MPFTHLCTAILTQSFGLIPAPGYLLIHAPLNPPIFADWNILNLSNHGRKWGDVRRTGE